MESEASRNQHFRGQLVEVQLDDGTTFYVKVLEPSGESEVSLRSASFEEAMKAIEGIGKRLNQVWGTIRPGKASVELGIDFTWQAGKVLAVLVDSSTTASMKITLEWNREPTKEQ
jgi:Trypsin-co-occurring domain 1